MTFYSTETFWGLAIASVPAIASIYTFFVLNKEKLSLVLLLVSALLLRLLAIQLDPYLHEWDERFHALVAKNMMDHPFKPMLRVDPVMSFDYKAWCCSHIWVHKQPLFLWQMAASMKLFGVTEVAMRLPSAIMGVISVFFVYQIASYWTKNLSVAFLSAILCTFSFYQLELISGRYGLDHNDLAFTFYLTASFSAFVRYLKSGNRLSWALLVGVLVGCAILNKWLTALVVYGGWGLYVLLTPTLRTDIKKYWHIAASVVVACVVFVPWQLYIMQAFPAEAQWAYELNALHITQVLDKHDGNAWYHIDLLKKHYSKFLLPFLALGIIVSLASKKLDRRMSVSFLAVVVVVYLFFSVVATKMSAFVFPVSSLMFVLIAIGLCNSIEFIVARFRPALLKPAMMLAAACVAVIFLKPRNLTAYRSTEHQWRNNKIHNTNIYKSLEEARLADHIILNCKGLEESAAMFHSSLNVYPWYPDQVVLDSLQQLGHKFAAFKNHGDQQLPHYIVEDPEIVVIDKELRGGAREDSLGLNKYLW